ncbi:uncharacterized protein LOC102452715 isoform X1 [Pelodiscus sinensis]|uniref:uncharacterized protein LOC102452715 isoform X1 n=1 Tax=Pelodiscus sinensis TaxID=13735 RepID=UPI003F6AE6DF
MDEAQYLASEENIPLAPRSWLWKKKRNSVFPAAESQSKAEVWVQTVIPSSTQVTEDSLRSDVEPKSQATLTSSVPLPGSVTAYLDEMQVHPSSAIRSITIDEEIGQVGIGQRESWLNKLRINGNKLAFLKCLIGWKGSKTAVEEVAPGVCSPDNHRPPELDGCMAKEEQPYIPYKLAKLYITKIVKDMQQMKIRHMKVIKELDCIRKDNQEQAITVLKSQHSGKMKILKAQLEAYQELVNKKNRQWQNTAKSLREKNGQLSQENKDLLYQIKQQNEKWAEEKTWILESFTQKLDHLYTQHFLTLRELQRIRLNMEKMVEIVNFQMDFPQQKALVTAEKVVDQVEEHEHVLQKELLWKAQATLEVAKQSLYKREREVTELLQSESEHKTMKPQITVTTLMKTLVSKVHTLYCDVPEAQQYINRLIDKNDAERDNRKEEFNNVQADILSYEVIYGKKPTDYKSANVDDLMLLIQNNWPPEASRSCPSDPTRHLHCSISPVELKTPGCKRRACATWPAVPTCSQSFSWLPALLLLPQLPLHRDAGELRPGLVQRSWTSLRSGGRKRGRRPASRISTPGRGMWRFMASSLPAWPTQATTMFT